MSENDANVVQIDRGRWERVLLVATTLVVLEDNPIESVGPEIYYGIQVAKNEALAALQPDDLRTDQ